MKSASAELANRMVEIKAAAWHYENTPIQIYWKFHHQ